jgi:hypothetical protein
MTINKALRTLIDRADELILSIEGTTDQFDAEINRLSKAIVNAENILRAGAQ